MICDRTIVNLIHEFFIVEDQGS